MVEFYKDDTAVVFYDPELDTLFLEYIGKVKNDDDFIIINTAVLDAFKELQTQKFVADIRKMGVISINAQKWVVENLLPGMIKHLNGKKLLHAQLLDPKEVFSRVSAVNIQKNSKTVEEGFEVIQFTDADEMKKHLKSYK